MCTHKLLCRGESPLHSARQCHHICCVESLPGCAHNPSCRAYRYHLVASGLDNMSWRVFTASPSRSAHTPVAGPLLKLLLLLREKLRALRGRSGCCAPASASPLLCAEARHSLSLLCGPAPEIHPYIMLQLVWQGHTLNGAMQAAMATSVHPSQESMRRN